MGKREDGGARDGRWTSLRALAVLLAVLAFAGATWGFGAQAATAGGEEDEADAAEAADADATGAEDGQEWDIEAVLADVETPQWAVDAGVEDCASCHAAAAESTDDDAYLYAEHAGISCFTCHSDEEKLAARHKNATEKRAAKLTQLKKTGVDTDMCLVCHDTAALAEATADSTALTDDKGTTVNPHDLPDVEDHAGISCVSCHQFHVADVDVEAKAASYCMNCHHAGVYECGTCH